MLDVCSIYILESCQEKQSCFWYKGSCRSCGSFSLTNCPSSYCTTNIADHYNINYECVSNAFFCNNTLSLDVCDNSKLCYISSSECRWCGSLMQENACQDVIECMWVDGLCLLQKLSVSETNPGMFNISWSLSVIILVISIMGFLLILYAIAIIVHLFKSSRLRQTQDTILNNFFEKNIYSKKDLRNSNVIQFSDYDDEAFHLHCKIMIENNSGTYHKTCLIGRGSSGSVYIGVLSNGYMVAVKEILMNSSSDFNPDEVKITSTLIHPYVVRIYGFHFDPHKLCLSIFMELLGNGSIGNMVRRMDEPLPEDIAKTYAKQLVSAVSYIHSRGVIHRDIKCDNLLLTRNGSLKLSDFGSSKKIELDVGAKTMVGTPFFMAPEVILGNSGDVTKGENSIGYGKEADVWSIGITLLEMMNCGTPPWPVMNTSDFFFYIATPGNLPLLPISKLTDLCVDFIMNCCLLRDPCKRKKSVELLEHPWLKN